MFRVEQGGRAWVCGGGASRFHIRFDWLRAWAGVAGGESPEKGEVDELHPVFAGAVRGADGGDSPQVHRLMTDVRVRLCGF